MLARSGFRALKHRRKVRVAHIGNCQKDEVGGTQPERLGSTVGPIPQFASRFENRFLSLSCHATGCFPSEDERDSRLRNARSTRDVDTCREGLTPRLSRKYFRKHFPFSHTYDGTLLF